MQKDFTIELTKLEEQLNALKTEEASLDGQEQLLIGQIEASSSKLIDLAHKREVYTKEVEVLTIIQELTRNKIKEGFENIVTYALKYVFEQNYKFKLEFDRRGNMQEVDFNILAPNRTEATDPMDSESGGIMDVASIALRIALLELSQPKIEGAIVLDESFKGVWNGRLNLCSNFLLEINKQIHRQIIMVTQQDQLAEAAHNVITLEKDK